MPAAVMQSIMDNYLNPLALFMGASAQQIGFLVALPQLISSAALLYAVNVINWLGSRKRFLIAACTAQAAIVAVVPLLLLRANPLDLFWLLLLLAIVFKSAGNFIATAWGSLMSEYLPPEKIGHYMGFRFRVVGIVGLAGMTLAGFTLYKTKVSAPVLGFFLVFLSAALCRFVSAKLMTLMADLPMIQKPGSDFTFWMFIRRFRSSNFVKFVLFVAGIMFSAYISAPYISVFMLRDLKFDYLSYTAVCLASTIGSLVAFPIWGRHADMVGNAKPLKTASLLIPLIPILWMLDHHPAYLVCVEFFSGFVWGGFNLCATNFIYDAVTPEKRIRCIGYFNLFNGIAVFAGASLGGYLASKVPPLFGYSLQTLFALSCVLRFASRFILSRHFREVRKTAKHVSSTELFFSVIGVKPISARTHDKAYEG